MVRKEYETTEGPYKAPPFRSWVLIALITAIGSDASIHAQNFLGAGFHLTPPIRLSYTGNANVNVTPLPGMAGSLSYKKEWAYRANKKGYWEAGLTTQGLRYYQVDYFGDSLSIWGDWVNAHLGFPSIFFGAGQAYKIGNSNSELSIGAEASLLLEQTLGEIGSRFFGISNGLREDRTGIFPLFLRLNLAYNHEFRFFKSAGQLQVYTKLSFQTLTKGRQYIYDEAQGVYQEGRYSVNSSELGIKFFAGLNDKKVPAVRSGKIASGNVKLLFSDRKTRFRLSINGQLSSPPPTVYHIPQVDSFSVYGRKFLMSNAQIGVTAEFPFRKHGLWATVVGLGIGNRVVTMRFESDGRFPSDNNPINFERHISIGHYLIGNIGISRRHALGRRILSHTLSASVVLPTEKEYEYLGVPLDFNNNGNQLPPYENALLEGWIDYDLGRAPILFGIEYNPEIVFHSRHRTFLALGLVVNYSGREVMAHGTFKVTNRTTTYYGAMLQRFSKLGVTLRVGFEK